MKAVNFQFLESSINRPFCSLCFQTFFSTENTIFSTFLVLCYNPTCHLILIQGTAIYLGFTIPSLKLHLNRKSYYEELEYESIRDY